MALLDWIRTHQLEHFDWGLFGGFTTDFERHEVLITELLQS